MSIANPAVGDGARVIFGHLEDETCLSEAMRSNEIVFHLAARAVIASLIAQALRRDHIALGDPTPRRDLLFVEGTARGRAESAAA